MKVGKHNHVQTIKHSSEVEVQENTEEKQCELRLVRQSIARLQKSLTAQLEVEIFWVDER